MKLVMKILMLIALFSTCFYVACNIPKEAAAAERKPLPYNKGASITGQVYNPYHTLKQDSPKLSIGAVKILAGQEQTKKEVQKLAKKQETSNDLLKQIKAAISTTKTEQVTNLTNIIIDQKRQQFISDSIKDRKNDSLQAVANSRGVKLQNAVDQLNHKTDGLKNIGLGALGTCIFVAILIGIQWLLAVAKRKREQGVNVDKMAFG